MKEEVKVKQLGKQINKDSEDDFDMEDDYDDIKKAVPKPLDKKQVQVPT